MFVGNDTRGRYVVDDSKSTPPLASADGKEKGSVSTNSDKSLSNRSSSLTWTINAEPAHSTRLRLAQGIRRALEENRMDLRRMACHEQASGPSNGYRAWIRTMNNASKGPYSAQEKPKIFQQFPAIQRRPAVALVYAAVYCWRVGGSK
jgi:hypothetical protein